MIKPYLRWSLAAIILSLAACIDNDIPDPAPVITAGTADFTRYVAIGNSLAAGYTNGGLYNAGIQVAYPSLLAGQFALAKGGSFTSPLFPADQPNGTGYLQLTGYNNTNGRPGTTQVAPQSVRPGTTSLAGSPLYTKYMGDLNNYGVPGIKVANILDATYGNFNGFYERLLPGNAGSNTTSYRDFVFSKPFTFFTVELGSNDVLDYAISDGMTASRVLTDPTLFNANYNNLVSSISLRAGARNGVLATVPDVTVLPYFHYITLAALKAAAAARGINRPIYIQALIHVGRPGNPGDPDIYFSRQATDRDLFMLPFEPGRVGFLNYGTTPTYPIESSFVLDENEVSLVRGAITGYNNTIKTLANQSGYPIFDAYTLFNQLNNGVTQDGVTINTNFVTGGVFSLDGIHLTPRGNAYVADEIIKVINTKYGSNLPALDISKYGGAGSN